MKAIKIKEGIYWVGAIDWDLRNFHGYSTNKGSTYNAYLIVDEKIVLIDTVKNHMADEMIERISSVIDIKNIDIIISNHVEMDHSGALPKIAELCPKAKIYTSPNGFKGLTAHYKEGLNLEIVKSGDSVNTGKRNLNFILTPMVHWPDNMAAYMPEEKIIFSNDAFGQHIASVKRFADELPYDIVMEQAAKYYANIVLPYGRQVKKALEGILKLDIQVIAPSHGMIWRNKLSDIIEKYTKWSDNKTLKKAVIVYDTMWNSTKKIAYSIKDALIEKEYNVIMCNLNTWHISDIMTEILTAEYICVGSPTLNNNMLPGVSAFLTYLTGLAPKNRKAAVFGSYGWGGQSTGNIEEILSSSGFNVTYANKINYIPSKEDLKNIYHEMLEVL